MPNRSNNARSKILQLLLLTVFWSGCPGSIDTPYNKNNTDGSIKADDNDDDSSDYKDSATPISRTDAQGMRDQAFSSDVLRSRDGEALADSQIKYDKKPGLDKKLIPDKTPTKTDLGCASNKEILDGKDNNCNGLIDEGFWTTVFEVTYAELTQYQAGCNSSNTFSDYCTSGANRYCQARGYTGGFGPVEYGANSGQIVCLANAQYSQVTYATLTAQHSYCPSYGQFSVQCNSAIHRLCGQRGYISGVGPVEHIGDQTADIICTQHARLYQVSFNTLAQYHSGCTGTQNAFSPSCQAAINRFCQVNGHVTGFGAVEYNVDAAVTCLNRQ